MKIPRLIPVVFALLITMATADPYEVGSKVKPFTAKDQHGEQFTLDNKTRFLLLSDDMGTGKLANTALTKKGKEYLPNRKAVYVANIFGMPGIGRMFAFKKMKKYSHRIIYGDDENLMTPFPKKDSHVTVLKLNEAGKITRISFWDPKKEDVETCFK